MYFLDRSDAGHQLARALEKYRGQDVIVLGIPRGGVATAYAIAAALHADLDVIVPRKLPLPFSPEAGFGAIAEDGTIILNEALVSHVGLSAKEIQAIADHVLVEVRRRVREYRGERPPPELEGRVVILVDDGLATGYTMLAAIHSLKKQSAARIVVAVPCSPASTVEEVQPLVDDLVCLVAPDTLSFAVADYYQDFHDMTDDEVKQLLTQWTADSEP
jgi:putative phosphoribosyl transferase